MTVNLHAVSDFEKGDVGRVDGHTVVKADHGTLEDGFVIALQSVKCSPVDEQRWGSVTRLTLPGGGKLGVYQPKHASPLKASAT